MLHGACMQVPTTVFTSLEYGSVGMSEEAAELAVGSDSLEVYHSYVTPLQWALNKEEDQGRRVRPNNSVFCKILTHRGDRERLLGVHYLGPYAGEIIQVNTS